MTCAKIIPLLFAPLLIASTAMSQTGEWEAVQALRSGTKIKVTLKNRPTFGHCFMDGASDDQLVCISGRWPLSRRKVYLRDDIKAVYLTHNGPAIGLGVGAGAGAAIGASRSSCCHAANALLGAGALGVIGWVSGTVAVRFFMAARSIAAREIHTKTITIPRCPTAETQASHQRTCRRACVTV